MHSPLCQRLVAGSTETRARCRRCAVRQLALTLKSGHRGHRFTCFLGVHNYWLPIVIRRFTVGLVFVQALDRSAAKRFARLSAINHQTSTTGLPAPASRQPHPGPKAVSRSEFDRAAKLLQLVFEHVETSTLSDLRMSDLTHAQQALGELQTVATRLREELNGLVPAFNKSAPMLQPENHVAQIVHEAMDYVHKHYARPMTLRQCANALDLTSPYLSTLFAQTVGLPFKTYLTDVRLEKARVLLSDATRSITDVAAMVGYASENCFRLAFKRVTGLSPKSWRETFAAIKLCFLCGFLEELDCVESAAAFLL